MSYITNPAIHMVKLAKMDEFMNKKHLKNVGPIRHCEPPHAALPFTRCRYCRVERRLRIDVYNDSSVL